MEKNNTLISDFQADLGAIELVHTSFDDKERILMGVPTDQITKKETRSKVTDPTLLSAILKQNNAVMAQMPSGKITALTKENKGKSLFMDLILHNHVIPHATSQYDVYTKLWLLSFYRKVYGSFGVLVDFVDKSRNGQGYIGPDFTLLPARSIIPQAGKTTVEDSDRVFVRSKVSKRWLESLDTKGSWKNIDKVLKGTGDSADISSQSFTERQFGGAMVRKDEYDLVTCYEPDRWRTFHAATKEIIRDIKNPQKNDQIPVIMCHSYPLLDRFFGLGDFERGMALHNSLGSLINLYLDGVKMSIFPPFKVDPMAVDNWDDFKDGIGPGQLWLMKKTMFDGIEQMNPSPAGIQSFQSTYQFLKGAVMTVANTSDTTISQATDPAFGKTPQALKMQQFNQGTQAQFDRRMLELATEKIFDRMIDLISKRQEKSMPMYLKEADLRRVEEVAPDVIEMFDVGEMGKITIKPQEIKNVEYRYEIDQGSTVKKDEIMENQSLTELITFIKEIPGAVESLAQGGMIPLGDKQLSFGELIKRWIISSGMTDWDKIILDNNQQEENALNMEEQDVTQSFQEQMPQQPMQPMPQQSMQQQEDIDPAIAQVMQELQSLGQGGVR